ncbi:CPBP family intramembrane glutamic endopeptidase [Lysobacter sp. P5_B9]
MQLLSARSEFLLVVTVAFGYSLYASVTQLLVPSALPPITDAGLRWLIVEELMLLALLGALLKARGWRRAELGLGFTARDLPAAVGLVAAFHITLFAMMYVCDVVLPGFSRSLDGLVAGGITLSAAVAVSIVNPIFEEVFVCAYIIRALERTHSTAFAVNVSVAIRVAYHLYQGPAGAMTIIPFGLMLGWWFARTGRLWPAVIAHGILDLWALAIPEGG